MDSRRIGLAVATLASTCACVWLSFSLLPESSSLRPWKGARLLAVSAERAESEVLSALDSAGLRGAVSESRQVVAFSNFDEWDSAPLDELDSRLVEADPRRDPYIEGLSRFFRASSGAQSYRLYYLPDSVLTSAALRKRIAKALGSSGSWELVESEGRKTWLEGAVAWMAAAFALFLLAKGKRLRVVPPLFAWIGIFLSSSWIFLLACMPAMALFYIINLALRRYPYEKRYRIRALFAVIRSEIGLLPLCLLIAGSLPGFALLPASYPFSVLAAIGFAVFLEAAEYRGKRESGRRPFIPVALGKRRGYAPTRKGEDRIPLLAFAAFSLSLAALSSLSFSFPEASRSPKNLLSFPHPHGYTVPAGGADALPNYQDYLEHAEYQRRFLEADLSGSREARAFAGYSRKKDGSLAETAARAERLGPPSETGGGGLEAMLRRAGEKAVILEGPWKPGGNAASYGAWSLPIALSAVLLAFAARIALERSRGARSGLAASAG